MHRCPLEHKSMGARWQASSDQFQRPNVEFRAMPLVLGVKMRRVVVQEEHLDDDPIETAEFRHSGSGCLFQLPNDILLCNDPEALLHLHQHGLTSIAQLLRDLGQCCFGLHHRQRWPHDHAHLLVAHFGIF